ncbi:ficolin-1-like [Saccostrea echinata]|uniref:ficolin-1-like n=1 Tax=Saccostrea echinata TaxID=191078 RepID=UPI002A7F577B|nr:ficolin-1-like [Saccostrea echinata]
MALVMSLVNSGNEVIHLLTSPHRTQFYIGISSTNGSSWYERFDNMKVASEAQNYTITLGKASGTAGDLSKGYAGGMNGISFSTYDRDNDRWAFNCAVDFRGGWWFDECGLVFLNAPRGFGGDQVYQGVLNMTIFNSSILMITRM